MNSTYEKSLARGKAALKAIIAKNDNKERIRNEAETRFHVIDEIIQSCLFWEKDLIHVEVSHEQKYTDYELGIPRKAIWEAKKEGISFELPANSKKKPLIDIQSIFEVSGDAKKAIQQARGYCSERGVQVAVVTNGFQVIAFLATRTDGTPPLEGKALAFDSLEDIHDNFEKFWQFLSYDGIQENRIVHYLTSGNIGLPSKLSSKLVQYPKVRYSSDFNANLKQLSELLIQDIIENKEIEGEFYKRCYCESGALSQYSLISKNILNK